MKDFFYNKISNVVSNVTLIDSNTKIQCLKHVLSRFSGGQGENATIFTRPSKDINARNLISDLNQIEILFIYFPGALLAISFGLLVFFLGLSHWWAVTIFWLSLLFSLVATNHFKSGLKEVLNILEEQRNAEATDLYLKK